MDKETTNWKCPECGVHAIGTYEYLQRCKLNNIKHVCAACGKLYTIPVVTFKNGVKGDKVRGSRKPLEEPTLIIIDDMEDEMPPMTDDRLKRIKKWYNKSIIPRKKK